MSNRSLRLASFLLVAFLAGSFAGVARAGTLVLDIGPGATPSNLTDDDWTQGTEIILSTSLLVDGLGYLDLEGDGLGASHDVAVWTAGGALAIGPVSVTPTSATVASANGTAQWFVAAITPTVLDPGTYRIGGTFRTSEDASANNQPLSFLGVTRGTVELAPGVHAPGYVRSNIGVSALTFPGEAWAGGRTTVTLTATAVPEPAAGLLLGAALLTLAGRRHAA